MISVVIPTLNAAAGLPSTLDQVSIEKRSLVHEIIVSDGGSRDKTREIAAMADCTVVQGPPGRGQQLRAGALQANGDWLLFLHADTRLGVGWEDAAHDFVRRTSDRHRAAVFTFKLDDRTHAARVMELAVAARVKLFGLPYGDQGLLLSRAFYDELGGFKLMPLMEDVDLVRRIGRARLESLSVPAVTSAERYRRNGYVRRVLRNAACLCLYFIGVPPRSIAKLYE
ncbi:TIGR04283 family arsenosugar biosynthesis glycosyltransferase [Rhodopseudomonas palustris]|nr:TIGR04283 family arsenosugar biosynthesis glycosyltransferase [Rhodopseudomonas palustris]